MPISPNTTSFTLVITSDDPDLRASGDIAREEAPREVLIEGVLIKTIHSGNTWPGKLPAGKYIFSFDLSKKGKLMLSARTAANPKPAPEPFEAKTNEQRFNRIFRFEIR